MGSRVEKEDGVSHKASAGAALTVAGLRYTIGERVLLDGVGVQVQPGESVAITGPSGSGKSTLLSCLLGLIKPQDGTIEVQGSDITRMGARQLARHRRDTTGMVFQFGELLPELTPVENVALAALLSGLSHKEAYARAASLLADLGVPTDGAATDSLSGGERQRAAVARALINQPRLLLADEPTGALDEANRESVAELLFSVPQRWNCALVVVTHDTAVAARADRHLALHEGRLVAQPKAGR
ncbi:MULTISPECIES: ABC transporter ATP-binding protein [Streptomyces]|uniref:ABC transporter ATP-binding protein n=1 Tax=Streptomyces TaxID=1883 RepID=UPI000AFCDCD8|nr:MULTISPECIES: ABC transporter ATP-binding protein [Streptomyces]